ncbi:MAG: hypothetical protein NDI84_12560 [Steroidobacteraceae bacterium]|nr:hypothetical protein [Steroidobacteraceae bacterium]
MRTLLHDANNELSIAVLQLGILLEDAALQPALKGSVEDSLAACSRAAAVLRELWALLDHVAARR